MNFAEAIKVSTKGVLHTHVLLSLGSVTDAQVNRKQPSSLPGTHLPGTRPALPRVSH